LLQTQVTKWSVCVFEQGGGNPSWGGFTFFISSWELVGIQWSSAFKGRGEVLQDGLAHTSRVRRIGGGANFDFINLGRWLTGETPCGQASLLKGRLWGTIAKKGKNCALGQQKRMWGVRLCPA